MTSNDPTFLAIYTRPDWAHQIKMSCGHSASSYDSAGRCMWPGCERGYPSGFTTPVRAPLPLTAEDAFRCASFGIEYVPTLVPLVYDPCR